MSLDSFIKSSSKSTSSRSDPIVLSTSQEIRDRASLFVAHLYRARGLNDARAAQQHAARLHKAAGRPSHAMYAFRAMTLKPGRTGLEGEDDYKLDEGKEDDGEKWGGDRILRVMKDEGVLDATIVVLRWFGGEMLGPSRFTHIETCAREACRDFKVADELRDAVLTLQTLDDDLAKHRVTLAALSETQAPSDINEDASTSKDTGDNTTEDTGKDTVVPDITTVPSTSTTTLAAITAAKEDTSEALLGKRKRPVADTSASKYEDLVSSRDVKKARRLITARENAVRTVKGMLQKKQEEQLEQAKEKEQVERRHEEGKQEHGKQENGKQEEGTQEERVVVVEQNESSVPSIIDELFEAEKNSKPQPRLDGHGTEST